MRKKKTARGFTYYEFEDANGIKCSLQESSSAMSPKIWLGSDEEPKMHLGEWLSSRMHIDIKTAKKLIPLLQTFVDTGSLIKDTTK